MNEMKFVCIVCPNSCKLTVAEEGGELTVTGAACSRGIDHGKNEYTEPKRMLTTTVLVEQGIHPRISVISNQEIKKANLTECLEYLYQLHLNAPVTCGQTIVKNICGTGVDIIASRAMEKR